MINRVIIILFVSVVSIASVETMATTNETDRNVNSALAISSNANNGNLQIQKASVDIEKVSGIHSQENGEGGMSLPATGWLLFVALLGFVILSNR